VGAGVVAVCERAALAGAVVSAEVAVCEQAALVAVMRLQGTASRMRVPLQVFRIPSGAELTSAEPAGRTSVCLADLATGLDGVGAAATGEEAGAEIIGPGMAGVGVQPRSEQAWPMQAVIPVTPTMTTMATAIMDTEIMRPRMDMDHIRIDHMRVDTVSGGEATSAP